MRNPYSLSGSLLLWALLVHAAPALADVPYSGSMVTIASTTNGQAVDLPATLLKPEGPGPFPAIVIMHDKRFFHKHMIQLASMSLSPA